MSVRIVKPVLSSFYLAGHLLALMVGMHKVVLAQSAIRSPGSTPVGMATAPMTVNVLIRDDGQISAVGAFAAGIAGLDFYTVSGGSCLVGQNYAVGQTCTVNVGFRPIAPGERRGAVVLIGSNGKALGTTYISGAATGPLAVFAPARAALVAGVETLWKYQGDGVLATQAPLFLPYGVAVDGARNLFIADTSNNRIRRVDAKSGLITTIAGTGKFGSAGDGGPAAQAQVGNPTAMLVDGAGNLLFSDSGNGVVRRIDAVSGMITTIAGVLGTSGYAGDGGSATSAALAFPNGLSLDRSNNLFIADTGNNVIRRVDGATGIIITVAGTGAPGFTGDGGPAIAATFNAPWGVTASDESGALYIADQNNNRVRSIDAGGIVRTIAGTGRADFKGDLGPAIQADLFSPATVALDVAGNIYIADTGNNRVRRINASTGIITTFAGWTTTDWPSDTIFYYTSAATAVGLHAPYSLAFDSAGNLFIADVLRNMITEVVANQGILTYDNLVIGNNSPVKVQALENDGNASLTPNFPAAQANVIVDSPTTTCSTAKPLAPSEQCFIGARFAPTDIGFIMWDLGTINLYSDSANSPGVLSLSAQVNTIDTTNTSVNIPVSPLIANAATEFNIAVVSSSVASQDSRLTSLPTTPTGSVSLFDGGSNIGSASLISTGLASASASIVVSTLSAGTHTITASYAGDASNHGSISPAFLQIVQAQAASTSTTLTSSAGSVDAGTNLNLIANVTAVLNASGIVVNGGTVTFYDGATVLGVVAISNGSAMFNIATLTAGQHILVARFSGSSAFAPSFSAQIAQRITLSTKASLTSSANPVFALDPLTINVTVVNGSSVPPTGTVYLKDSTIGGVLIGTAAVDLQGDARFIIVNPNVGTHRYVATYGGDSLNDGAVSPAFAQVVSLHPVTVALISSTATIAEGDTISFAAFVQGTGPWKVNGPVTFQSGANVLGVGTISGAGIATFQASPAAGVYNVVASYPGDVAFASALSAPLTITVTQPLLFNLRVNTSTLALKSGEHGSIQIQIDPASHFSDTIALGCAGLPLYATCTFSKSNLNIINGGSARTTLVIDTGDPLGVGASVTLNRIDPRTTACFLPGFIFLLGMISRKRRLCPPPIRGLWLMLLSATVACLSGCGSSFTQSSTAPGVYTIQVVGTVASTGMARSSSISITVSP